MKRAICLAALLAGACAATPTPTRNELAETLGARSGADLAPIDVTHIACPPVPEEPTEFACRWRQREGRVWTDWQSYFALSGDGWQLIDEPRRRP